MTPSYDKYNNLPHGRGPNSKYVVHGGVANWPSMFL
jgi:hypothetical protein